MVSHSYDGAAADMWALGVSLFILLTGSCPFRDSNAANLFQKIKRGHSAVVFPSSMSAAARDIIRRLLVTEPHMRLTADELIDDLWLSEDAVPCWAESRRVVLPAVEAAAPVHPLLFFPTGIKRFVSPTEDLISNIALSSLPRQVSAVLVGHALLAKRARVSGEPSLD